MPCTRSGTRRVGSVALGAVAGQQARTAGVYAGAVRETYYREKPWQLRIGAGFTAIRDATTQPSGAVLFAGGARLRHGTAPAQLAKPETRLNSSIYCASTASRENRARAVDRAALPSAAANAGSDIMRSRASYNS